MRREQRNQRYTPPNESVRPNTVAVEKLAKAVRIATVPDSHRSEDDPTRLQQFQDMLQELFPLVYARLEVHRLDPYSIYYVWHGVDEHLSPILLLSHYDVVPASDDHGWAFPPWSGAVSDGFVWGRGTLDMKIGVITILEALEQLLVMGFVPRRSIYVALGGDEETGGRFGARRIAAELRRRGVTFEFILDEGAFVLRGVLPDLHDPVALIGVAEKGHVNAELSVHGMGGHASAPPRRTAVGTMSRAIHRLESCPFPPRLTQPVRDLIAVLRPYLPWWKRVLYWCHRVYRPVVFSLLSNEPETDALIRTTQAATVLEGSSQASLLPANARAVVNLRILPGETVTGTVDRLQSVVRPLGVTVRVVDEWDATDPVYSHDYRSNGYSRVCAAVGRVLPDAICAPFVVSGSTDSRHYRELSPTVLRLSPIVLRPSELQTVHGVNERISFENVNRCLHFYVALVQDSCG